MKAIGIVDMKMKKKNTKWDIAIASLPPSFPTRLTLTSKFVTIASHQTLYKIVFCGFPIQHRDIA